MDGDAFEDSVRRLDPDRWLASRFVGEPDRRSDLIVLLAFEAEIARTLKVTSQPITARIRLTWWGEVLDEIATGGAVRAHPLAQALAQLVRRRDLSLDRLHDLIAARWDRLDAGRLSREPAETFAEVAGGAVAALSTAILAPAADPAAAEPAGALIALSALLAEGALDAEVGEAALARALPAARASARRLPPAAFPAVAAATLARRRAAGDLERRLRLLCAVALGRI